MRWGSLVVLLVALAFATSSGAAEPSGSALQLEFVTTASSPVYVTAPPGDTSRLFIVQQGSSNTALIRLMRDGGALTTFLTVNQITTGGERGLLSMAFAPNYATSRKFYVYYTDPQGDMTVAEYLRDATNPDIADPSTRRVVIEIPHPGASNHNGGQLQFGPDGYLYLATGDGGGGGDPFRSAQNLEDLRGKLLRIDPLRPTVSSDKTYTIPSDNPFVGVPGRDEIWAYGLRNPWRFSFDRQTGDLTIGDVGQNAWEEIDFAPAPNAGRGMNFGWSCMEGRHAYNNGSNCPEPPNHTRPVLEYAHDPGCSVSGGYVVRDPTVPSLFGRYLYTDWCASGTPSFALRSVVLQVPDAIGDQGTGLNPPGVTSFGEDAQGRIYVASSGNVHRLRETEPPPPPPPSPIIVSDPGCRVPRVVGRTVGVARRAIRSRVNCRVGGIRHARSKAPRGRIISQRPPGGMTRLGSRVSVHLVVSRGNR